MFGLTMQSPLAFQSIAGLTSCGLGGSFSCHNTTAQEDLCCFNAPGGLILQTQFWDTNPPTGGNENWTIHGLWPDTCDGSYDANCDRSRVFSNISDIIYASGSQGQETLEYMKEYWKDYQGDDETFWEHEWSKHGTCISTLNPECFQDSGTAETDGVLPYFAQAVALYKTLPTYSWLADAGIVPSNTAIYSKAAVLAVLKTHTGYEPYLGCQAGALNEVWYFFNVQGSLIDGTFQHTSIVGKTGTCGTSFGYLPKSSTPRPTKTRGGAPTPTATWDFAGKGYLSVNKGGCLISTGKWYKAGTCATFTATPSSAGENMFTLRSSKGNCALSDHEFVCSKHIPAGYLFQFVDGLLGTSGYSTAHDISRTEQASVFAGNDHSLAIEIAFLAF